MVMHRVLRALTDGKHESLLNRVAGAILIADGDKLRKDSVTVLGTAPKDSHGIADDTPAISGSSTFPLPKPWGPDRVFSICAKGDVVCGITNLAPPAMLLAGGAKIHTESYRNDPDVLKAVKALRFSFGVKISKVPQQVTGTAGQFVDYKVEAITNPSCKIAYKQKKNWPTWLSLSVDGSVRGVIPSSYRANPTYSVTAECTSRRTQVVERALVVDVRANGAESLPVDSVKPWGYGVGDITPYGAGRVVVLKCCKPRKVVSVAVGASKEEPLKFPAFEKADGSARVAGSGLGGVVVATQKSTKTSETSYVSSVVVELMPPSGTAAQRLPDVQDFVSYGVAVGKNSEVYVTGYDQSQKTRRTVKWTPRSAAWDDANLEIGPSDLTSIRNSADGDIYAVDERAIAWRNGQYAANNISREFAPTLTGGLISRPDYRGWQYVAKGAIDGAILDTPGLRNGVALAVDSSGKVWFIDLDQSRGEAVSNRLVTFTDKLYR